MTLQNLLERREVYEERTARAMRPFLVQPLPPVRDFATDDRRARLERRQRDFDWVCTAAWSGVLTVGSAFWWAVVTGLWRLYHDAR